MAGEATVFSLRNRIGMVRSPVPYTPDKWELLSDGAFGERLTTIPTLYNIFKLEDNAVKGYWNYDMLRHLVRPGDVMPGDPPTTERSEITSVNVVEPTIGGNPALGMSFDLWIPTTQTSPTGGSNLTIAQFKITNGDATQLMMHANGNLRLRNWTGSAYVYQNLLTDYRGRWLSVEMDGVHSKTTAGQIRIKIDGVTLYSRLNAANIPAVIGDAEKVYLKAGVYRTAVDTDPSRGKASFWFRNITYRQTFT